jgi:hypothetical protein
MDQMIHALMRDMLPIYEDCHKWQVLRMQGPNLAEKHQKEILACTPKTPLERIKEVGQLCFVVQSMSSKNTHEVNLLTYTCTCNNFPCIQLCKHVMATVHFFRGGILGPQAPVNESASERELDMPKSLAAQQDGSIGNTKAHASVISTANDIICTAQEILEMVSVDLEMAKSLQMA